MKLLSIITRPSKKAVNMLLIASLLTGCIPRVEKKEIATEPVPTRVEVLPPPAPDPAPVPKPKRKIKLGLLLDTSNSMDGLISQAKSQLWKIVNKIADALYDGEKPVVEIALYEYGNDNLNLLDGYIRQVTPLTEDLDQISADLFALTTRGGSEYCGEVISTSLDKLNWSTDTSDLQMIFIAGNEPFDQGNINFRRVCTAAKEKGISVNTIFCGACSEGVQTFWKEGARLGGGEYMCIEQDKQTVYIPSPYDDSIASLNSRLNNTYVYYGGEGFSKKENQTKQDQNAAGYGEGNSVTRIVSKSKEVYKNEKWDLVDASKLKSFDISKVEAKTLPPEMQTMTQEQRKTYIKQKEVERNSVKQKIGELNKKRETFIAQEEQKLTDEKSLDNSLVNSIKKKAIEKQFTFEK